MHISNADYGADYPRYAVEIQPPLSDIAAQGLCKALTTPRHPNADELMSPGGFAYEAFITRQDKEGTVLYVLPNRKPEDGHEVGAYIKTWLDPASLHELHIDIYHEGVPRS